MTNVTPEGLDTRADARYNRSMTITAATKNRLGRAAVTLPLLLTGAVIWNGLRDRPAPTCKVVRADADNAAPFRPGTVDFRPTAAGGTWYRIGDPVPFGFSLWEDSTIFSSPECATADPAGGYPYGQADGIK